MMKDFVMEKTGMGQRAAERPLPSLFWGIGGVFVLSLALLLGVQVGQGSVIWAVARALWHLVPGIVWLVATAVSLVWLLVIIKVWNR